MIPSKLPSELALHYIYLSDWGECVDCLIKNGYPALPNGTPAVKLSDIFSDINAATIHDYLIPVPVDYVLQYSYELMDGWVVVDAPLNSKHELTIDKKYVTLHEEGK
jgi:hypothetical protein